MITDHSFTYIQTVVEKGGACLPFFVEAGILSGARPSFGPGVFYTPHPLHHDHVIHPTGHTEQSSVTAPPLEVRIRKLAEEIIPRADWFIVDVQARGRKGSRVIEVYLDGDQGVSVDDMASFSRELAFLLDAEDLIKGKYHLNVSSPGDDRALLFERQYARHIGKPVQVLVNREEGGIWLEGENLGVKDGVLTLQTKSGAEEWPLEDITKARIKLPW